MDEQTARKQSVLMVSVVGSGPVSRDEQGQQQKNEGRKHERCWIFMWAGMCLLHPPPRLLSKAVEVEFEDACRR